MYIFVNQNLFIGALERNDVFAECTKLCVGDYCCSTDIERNVGVIRKKVAA